MSKFKKQINIMSDEQIIACARVLLDKESYELVRIVMSTPSHSREIQINSLRARIRQIPMLEIPNKLLLMDSKEVVE